MYELLYIVPGPLTEKDLPDVSKKIKNLVEKSGGSVVKENNLGNKKLAYPIKGVYRGFYLLVNFNLETKFLKDLDRDLKLMSEILRHLIIRVIERKQRVPVRKSEAKTDEVVDGAGNEAVKNKKIDLKNLGEKIDDLFKI